MRMHQQPKFSKADVWFQRAFAAHQAGDLKEAEALYRRVLEKTPADMETLYLLGTACSQQGRHEEALRYLQHAVTLQPRHPEALNNLGLTLTGMRKEAEAIPYYERALVVNPDYADAHNNLGNALQVLGKYDEAERHLRCALALSPGHADAYYNLGLVLKGRDSFEEATKCFLRGIALKPDLSTAYDDLGQIYKIWGRNDEALACFDKAVALAPNSSSAHNNRGAVLEEIGRFDDAFAEYARAADLAPDLTTARWNQAFLYLRQGVLDQGWDAHEIRLEAGQADRRFEQYPEWDGSSLEGKTILVYAEQGLGDEILFASCVPDLIGKAGHCVIECEPRLAPLFARSFLHTSVTVIGTRRDEVGWLTEVPPIDVKIAAGSLPRFFRRTLDSFSDKPAYLAADPARVAFWRSRVALLGPGLKVGICWRSGLTAGERHRYYSQLSQWKSIFEVEGVHFVNLQYGECTEELREAEEMFDIRIANFPDIDLRNDIDDSAALAASLDLVISAATAVSEIAGSVGVPVFRTDPFGPQWTSLGSDRMPWHPTMTLFGQPAPGDWNTPLALIGEAVRVRASGMEKNVDYVPVAESVAVATNGDLDDLFTYVLKEQGGWFDSEYRFVLDMIEPGMRVVDFGADTGAYAAPIAARIGDGRVWAITRNAKHIDLLMRTRLHNRLEKTMHVAIFDEEVSLDGEMDRCGLANLDLVRICTELCNLQILSRAERFFVGNSPLLMFGARIEGEVNLAMIEWLGSRGYKIYRLMPGANALLPLASLDELDAYSIHLFACKDDRMEMLAQKGLLVPKLRPLSYLPDAGKEYWQEYLSGMRYAEDMLVEWSSRQVRHKDWEVYWMALNLFAMAMSSNDAGIRTSCLDTAAGVMSTLVQESANLPRLLTLARILTEIGKREMAVIVLNNICELLNSGMPPVLNEPFLALADTFEMRDSDGRIVDWAVAMILEQRENLRAFSTFFTGQESLPALEEVMAMGYGGDDTARRVALIKERFAAG